MSENGQSWFTRWACHGFWSRCAVLTLGMLLVAMPVLAVAGLLGGPPAIGVAALTWAVCLAGGYGSELLAEMIPHPLGGMLSGLLIRMGAPLAMALVIQTTDGPLRDSGGLYYLLVFFPAILAIDTLVTVRRLGATTGGTVSSSPRARSLA